ncbi:immunoglobulin lambda-1 light chain-like isoform X2 [Pygocentrus nattereri]|uniref:immunoglobulin lambda-1 light chain-like isoform X2 n=1 Tax=Pygocentrus nattereri TaxID=42514 RepID=UPI001890C8A9|nr:immunoglobulin lambda-1 light chain-like isoform X2 [Pygocentrus nattereri]
MEFLFVTLLLLLTIIYPSSGVVNIVQEPKMSFVNLNSSVTLKCDHDNTDHYRMSWYRQTGEKQDLELLAFSMGQNSVNIEPPFDKTDKYKFTRPEVKKGMLQIKNMEARDSAIYFCATNGRNTPAYFGAGTKLTVLDPKITPSKPTVRILKPILNEECRKETVTVVCVADNFYPDHVKVSWTVGGVVRTDGVATDSAATQNSENKYNITSRLSISYKEWIKEAEINCTVTYTDPETNNQTSVTEYIKGPKRVDSEEEAEKYVPRGKTMLLAYGAFIIKGFLYGLFIMVVIRRQGFMSK